MRPFDASGNFRPTVEGGGLARLALRGAALTLFSGGLGLALQIIATVVLARLLTPTDFGLVAMVTTFSLLLGNAGLNGFTEAVLQREEVDHLLASNIFWLNLGIGAVLTILFACCGGLLAEFYHARPVTNIAIGLSVTILTGSASVLHLALLKRALRFSLITANDLLSRTVLLITSIALAEAGWGYWALIVGTISQQLTATIGAWVFCRWTPGRPRRNLGTGSVVRFAANTYGRFTLNYIARNTDNLLLAWRFDAQILGYYKKAYDLFALSASQLTTPLTTVAVAALSRLDPRSRQYRDYFARSLSILALVGMGLAGCLTLTGKDVIYLLLGPKWGEAGRIFTFFAPGIGVMLLYNTHGWIHLSIGKPDRWLRWGLLEVTATVALFALVLSKGPTGVAVAWSVSFWILTVPALWYAGNPVQFEVRSVLAAVWKYIAGALVAGCASEAIVPHIPPGVGGGAIGALERLAATGSMFLAFYAIAIILLHRGCEPFYRLKKLLPALMPGVKRGDSGKVFPLLEFTRR